MWLAEGDDDFGEPNWVPDEDRATVHLRLAGKGTLTEIERRYNREAIETFSELQVAAADDSDEKAQRAARKRLKASRIRRLRSSSFAAGSWPSPTYRKQRMFASGSWRDSKS